MNVQGDPECAPQDRYPQPKSRFCQLMVGEVSTEWKFDDAFYALQICDKELP